MMTPGLRSFLVVVALGAVVAVSAQWLGDRAQAGVGEQVAQLARPGDIRMISSLTCPSCTTARMWFQQHGVPFEECLIERDAACLETFQALPVRATPTLFVRGQLHTGFDAERVLRALQAGR
jgi:glutaredoxin